MKKKVILFSVLAIILLSMTLFLFAKIPSPQMDHKIFGSYFEKQIYEKYELTFVDETFKCAESAGYDSQTLSLTVHGNPQIYKYQDRNIYCSITADYKGKTITIRFKGTKIIGTKYKWSLENEDVFDVFKK